jgi:hypothetical protein
MFSIKYTYLEMLSKMEISGARSNFIFGKDENNFVAFAPVPNMILLDYVY